MTEETLFGYKVYKLSAKQKAIMERHNILPELLLKETLTKEEYEAASNAIGNFLTNSAVRNTTIDKRLRFSDKQKEIIKNNAPLNIISLSQKPFLTPDEFNMVKKWLDDYFIELNLKIKDKKSDSI